MISSKNNRLLYTEMAENAINRMTLEEKVFLLSGSFLPFVQDEDHYNSQPYIAGGLKRLDIPSLKFCDGPRGVVCGTGQTTCFPVSMLRGASFDLELEEKIGRAIANEIKVFGGNLFGGVCLNLPYHPGWGRSQETYGEDTFHIGEMGSALVRGIQGEHVIACIKHFAFNQMEISRFKVNIECDKRTEQEIFLPHFKKCIQQGAAAVMSSYNAYLGTPCGHHDYLLNQVLKKEWDFDGFVMSDFTWGIRDTIEAMNGGLDLEMNFTRFYGKKLIDAVKAGNVNETRINEAALRVVRTLLAFLEADHETKVRGGPSNILACKQHTNLALQSAREGITLIKNQGQYLPLDKRKTEKIAVFGHLADKDNLGDHGSSRVYPPYVVTPLQGIANAFPKAEVIYYSQDDMQHARDIAQDADAVVFVVGYDHQDEGEYIADMIDGAQVYQSGGDRIETLGLHTRDKKMIESIAPYCDSSIAVLIGGNMIMIEEAWAAHVKAILMAYYPGMEGGTAIGEIMSGQVNPSGKLPFVIPTSEQDLPPIKWDTEYQYYEYYHGYARLDKHNKKPAYPYGFGLSYTKFSISQIHFSSGSKQLKASCRIKNTGSRAGTEVLQLYVGFSHSLVDRPVKVLRDFKRVSLAPGESKEVTLAAKFDEICWFNPDSNQFEFENIPYDMYLGTSSSPDDLIKGTCLVKKKIPV